MKKYVLMLLIFALAINVSALGITPGRTTLNYEAGTTHEIPFTIVNSEGLDFDVALILQGELNNSITLNERSFSMSSTETSKDLTYSFTMPDGLEPGWHTADIIALQLPSSSSTGDTFVGATVGVTTQLHVSVPYPGKFVEADIHVSESENGGLFFIVPMVSRGDLNIVRASAKVEIFGALNEEVEALQTNEVEILSGERKEVAVEWDANVNPGTYRAVATIIYDEEVLVVETQFDVGSQTLELEQVVVNDFSLGGIAKLEMLVENKWGQDIEGVYAETHVLNEDNEVLAEFKSANYDIPALGKELIVSFWDTDGVNVGTYDTSVFLRYGEQSEQQDLQLKVSEDSITVIGVGYVISSDNSPGVSGNPIVIVLITVVVVLVLVNLLWFLYLRKIMKKKPSK